MTQQEDLYEQSEYLPNNEGALKIKLLTDELLNDIRTYLNGGYERTFFDETTGKTAIEKVVIGVSKCNDKGMQGIMFFLKTHFNQHIVLGNISDNQYRDILRRTRHELSKNLMIQRINYAISLADYSELMDYLMQSYEIYLSRTINAGDRTSITKSHSSVERSVSDQGRKKILGF